MNINLELLKKHGACAEGIDYFQKQYGEAEVPLEQVLSDANLPDEAKYWGIESLSGSPEDIAIYQKAMNIQDSQFVYHSKNVFESNNIVKSSVVKNSSFVYYSNHITDSSLVVYSSYVEGAQSTYNSEFIKNSNKIVQSENISNSNNICQSNFIINSENIFGCQNVENSNGLRSCTNMSNDFLCAECEDIKNSIFCYKLSETSAEKFFAFNTEVTKSYFDTVINTYKQLVNQFEYVKEWPDKTTVSPSVVPHTNYFLHYQFSKDFFNWIKKLPKYNGNILYNITMNVRFL